MLLKPSRSAKSHHLVMGLTHLDPDSSEACKRRLFRLLIVDEEAPGSISRSHHWSVCSAVPDYSSSALADWTGEAIRSADRGDYDVGSFEGRDEMAVRNRSTRGPYPRAAMPRRPASGLSVTIGKEASQQNMIKAQSQQRRRARSQEAPPH